MIDIYCDGGVIAKNPSPHGGTYALCVVMDGKMVLTESGVIARYGTTHITNNVSELKASYQSMLVAHKYLDFSKVTIWTDSQITIQRCTTSNKFNGVSPTLRDAVRGSRRTMKGHGVKFKLVGGHPTKHDLAAGFNSRGHPVSKWNVWCDTECTRLAKLYLESLQGDQT